MKVSPYTEVEFWKIDLKDETFRFRKEISEETLNALAKNMGKYGVQNRVKLRLKPNGRYQILAGWTRTLAVKRLGWPMMPAIVYEDATDEEAQVVNVIDNARAREWAVLAPSNYYHHKEQYRGERCR